MYNQKNGQEPNDPKQQVEENDLFTDNSDLEDDGTPVLDEADLDENNLSVEEAEDIEWEDLPEEDVDDEE